MYLLTKQTWSYYPIYFETILQPRYDSFLLFVFNNFALTIGFLKMNLIKLNLFLLKLGKITGPYDSPDFTLGFSWVSVVSSIFRFLFLFKVGVIVFEWDECMLPLFYGHTFKIHVSSRCKCLQTRVTLRVFLLTFKEFTTMAKWRTAIKALFCNLFSFTFDMCHYVLLLHIFFRQFTFIIFSKRLVGFNVNV